MPHTLLNFQFPYILFYFLFLFSCIVLATPVPSIRYLLPHIERRGDQADSEDTCGFKGDSDTYGLGIRISIYIQWLANGVSYTFDLEDTSSLRAVANCFQCAMFVGLIFVTVNQGSNLYAVEAFTVLILCIAGGFHEGAFKKFLNPETKQDATAPNDTTSEPRRASTIDPKKPNDTASESKSDASKPRREPPYNKLEGLGLFIQLLVNLALDGYAVWLVFAGMDNMRHPPCSTFGFAYNRVNLYGWLRTVLKLASIASIARHVLFAIVPIVRALVNTHILKPKDADQRQPTKPKVGDIWSDAMSPYLKLMQELWNVVRNRGEFAECMAKALWSLYLRGSFIMMVEYSIKWNHIEGLYTLWSTGQLLPLLFAVGGLCTTVDSWIHKIREDKIQEAGKEERGKQSKETGLRAKTPEIIERD